MATFLSAFDEAPKTPTRSFGPSKSKIVIDSPENSPPSSPVRSYSKRSGDSSRAPLSDVPSNTTVPFHKLGHFMAGNSKKSTLSVALAPKSQQPNQKTPTDTFSLLDDTDDSVSTQPQSRIEQMEQEVQSLKNEIKTLTSSSLINRPPIEEESQSIFDDARLDAQSQRIQALENSLLNLESKYSTLDHLNIQYKSKIESLEKSQQELPLDLALIKQISARRFESVVSALFPFLSDEMSTKMAKWLNESTDINSRRTMKKVWSLILVLDMACIFIQSKFPNWKQNIDINYIPKGWYRRMSVLRYCLEMILIVQFGIAAHQFITCPNTIKSIQLGFEKISNAFYTFVVKYLPTGIAVTGTATIAALVYRSRITM